MDDYVSMAKGTIEHSKECGDSPAQTIERLSRLLLEFANLLDGNEKCLCCNVWGCPVDMEMDAEGYLCTSCAKSECHDVE